MASISTDCGCGQAVATFQTQPRLRFRCHCTKCQGVYGEPYADALAFRRGQVQLADPDKVRWVRTMWPSPLIRGLCKYCNGPVLAHLFGALSLVPSRTVPGLELPQVRFDVYYRTRIAELNDGVPKFNSALATYVGTSLPFAGVLLSSGRAV